MTAHVECPAYRVQWERAQALAMCQAALVSIPLGADEFVGFCAGYLGEGEFVNEPFHVRFRGDETTHLVIGDRSVLTGREFLFERWPQGARTAVTQARKHLMGLVRADEEGFLLASPAVAPRIRWTSPDEGVCEFGKLDDRVWLRIPAQLGLTSSQSDTE